MLVFAKAAYDAGRISASAMRNMVWGGRLCCLAGWLRWCVTLPTGFARLYGRFSISASALPPFWRRWRKQFGSSAAIGLIGIFAAIYHPVGIAMLIHNQRMVPAGCQRGFGNMGVAAAPLLIGILLTMGDWRLCFVVFSLFCIAGVAFVMALDGDAPSPSRSAKTAAAAATN